MPALIHSDPRICDRRLRQYFNSTVDQWIDIVKAAVAARASCTENDAKAAPGFYAWNAALARSRMIFRREGWERGDHDGIETIWNADLRKMVGIMNTDSGTCNLERNPRNRTPKGPASEKVVNTQAEFFKAKDMGPLAKRPYALWYLCVYDSGGEVRAELARPIEYSGGYITDFSERIFLVRPGEWEQIVVEAPKDEDDYRIDVRRK
jgi:hypothetical protein